MSRFFFIFMIFASWQFSTLATDRMNFLAEQVQSLSELPIERLLKIKSTLLDNEDDFGMTMIENRSSALSLPMALPLKKIGNRKSIRRGDHWDDKGKDSKISKIFQLTVTALSFLAFGGYLLTLIIMATKRNQPAPTTGNVIVFSSLQSLQKYKRPKRRAWLIDPMEDHFENDRIYQGMIMLSECYALQENHLRNK